MHELEILLEPGDAPAFGHAEGVELHLAVTETDAEDEVAARDDIQRRDGFGGVDRVVEIQQQHAEPRRHVPRLRYQPGEKRNELKLLVVAFVEVVLAGEKRIPARVARGVHHDDLLVERRDHVGIEILLVGEKQSDFHCPFSAVTGSPSV